MLFTCRHQLRGRYVYVRLRNTDFLTLCEVEVFPTANAGMFSLYSIGIKSLQKTAIIVNAFAFELVALKQLQVLHYNC